MNKQIELREKAQKEKGFFDDFNEKSPYWDWRINNYANFEIEGSILKMYMGPTEALYYSNAEIADGTFDHLLWSFKTIELKARLMGKHYGSAGFGFWNYTMVIDFCVPIWFIYLRSRGPYPFQGFFAQVGNFFQPIMFIEKNYLFNSAFLFSKLSSKIIGVKIISSKPTMQELNLENWHEYKIEWKQDNVKFYIDGKEVAKINFFFKDLKARADAWIDNAVFEVKRRDAGKVYRHATQENRQKSSLEIDYIKIY